MQEKLALDEPDEPGGSAQLNLKNQRKSIITNIKNRIFGLFFNRNSHTLKESIEEVLDESEENNNPSEIGERAIIRNVLEFNGLYVEDVMIPRAYIFAVDEKISMADLEEKLLEKTYTRIPVYKNDLDDVIGFIHIKDIAKSVFKKENLNISDIIRKSLYVPTSMKISNLLVRMQQSRVHIAVVVDEYGGTEGIITMEDIVESIVGNIEDEHDIEDQEKPEIIRTSETEFIINSRVEIDEVSEKTGIDFNFDESEDIETIGGLVFQLTGRIPVKGEIVQYNDTAEIEVLEADARSIKKVKLKLKKK